MDHTQYKQLVSAYFDGQLSSEEKNTIEDHLASCVECQKYYRELQNVSLMLKTWKSEELSPDLENKFVRSLQKKKQETSKMKSPRFVTAVGGGGILVAVLVLLVSVQTYTQRLIQGRVHDVSGFHMKGDGRLKSAADDIGNQLSPGNAPETFAKSTPENLNGRVSALDKKSEYPPYYKDSTYSVNQSTRESQSLGVKAPAVLKRQSAGGLRRAETTTSYYLPDEEMQMLDRVQTQPSYANRVSAYGEWGDSVSFEPPPYGYSTEEYKNIYDNQFLDAITNPLSTLSIDVDTASYSNVRRFLNSYQMPPEDAVRIEEMINYFTYNYPDPTWNDRFSITLKASTCPWNTSHQLVQIGIQGKNIDHDKIPPSNLVFLIDVSGSMDSPDKLPLLKDGLKMMVNQLSDNERVAIVVYAGAAGLVLDSTPGSQKYALMQAIDSLQSGGSTAGGAGIQLAYQVAKANFIKGGNNRVILATDGDFNVGVSGDFELQQLIEEKRQDDIFLTVLGFGTGNLKDNKMETLANKGNGNYHYIDNETEARKVLVHELGSTIFTIAKDVKIQVEFNPAQVKSYRLIGYENRLLAKQHFNDDTKDAGELGAGHTVTALYEIVPANPQFENGGDVDPLIYQKNPPRIFANTDIMTVKLRFKEPTGNTSKLVKRTLTNKEVSHSMDDDFRFASAVAEFGMLLRNSPWKANSNYNHVLEQASHSIGQDTFGYRQEFLTLVEKARDLDQRFMNHRHGFEGNGGYSSEQDYYQEGMQFKGK